jgi:hypothetical protein
VLDLLQARRGRRFTLQRLANLTGLPSKRISWSLIFLRSQGLVRSRPIESGMHEWWAPVPGEAEATCDRQPAGVQHQSASSAESAPSAEV